MFPVSFEIQLYLRTTVLLKMEQCAGYYLDMTPCIPPLCYAYFVSSFYIGSRDI